MAAIILVCALVAVLMTQPAVGQLTTHLASGFEGTLGGFSLINSAGSTGVQRATVAFSAEAARSGPLGLAVNISSVSNTSYSWSLLLSVSMYVQLAPIILNLKVIDNQSHLRKDGCWQLQHLSLPHAPLISLHTYAPRGAPAPSTVPFELRPPPRTPTTPACAACTTPSPPAPYIHPATDRLICGWRR